MPVFTVVVAFDNTDASEAAVKYASDLCMRLVDYRLIVAFVVALNPRQTIPYIDHLEKAYNLEIEADAEKQLEMLKKKISVLVDANVVYEFMAVEGEGDVGPILETYVLEKHPETNLFVVGSRNNTPLKRWILGSVSDYLVHHLNIPVTVIKTVDK